MVGNCRPGGLGRRAQGHGRSAGGIWALILTSVFCLCPTGLDGAGRGCILAAGHPWVVLAGNNNSGNNKNGHCVLRAPQVPGTNPRREALLNSIHFVIPIVQMRKQPQRTAVTS